MKEFEYNNKIGYIIQNNYKHRIFDKKKYFKYYKILNLNINKIKQIWVLEGVEISQFECIVFSFFLFHTRR